MTDEFRTEAVLDVTVDESSLSDARDTVERRIGDVEVSVGSGDGRAPGDGGLDSVEAAVEGVTKEQNETNDRLDEIIDILQDGAGGATGAAGGGSGLVDTIVGGLASALPVIGSGGGLSGILGGIGSIGGAAGALAGGAGALLGLGGVNILERTGVLESVEQLGEDLGAAAPEGAGDLFSLLPYAPGAAALRPLAQGDISGAVSNFTEVRSRQLEVIQSGLSGAGQLADRVGISLEEVGAQIVDNAVADITARISGELNLTKIGNNIQRLLAQGADQSLPSVDLSIPGQEENTRSDNSTGTVPRRDVRAPSFGLPIPSESGGLPSAGRSSRTAAGAARFFDADRLAPKRTATEREREAAAQSGGGIVGGISIDVAVEAGDDVRRAMEQAKREAVREVQRQLDRGSGVPGGIQ